MPRSEFLRSDDLPISTTGASTTIVGAGGGGTVGTDAQTLQGHPAADFLSPSYVTLTNDGNLTSERALAVGSGLTMTDGGANGTVTLDLADAVAGAGLTISGKVLAVGAGLGITVNADDVALSSSVAFQYPRTDRWLCNVIPSRTGAWICCLSVSSNGSLAV